MPLYDFECQVCHAVFEAFASMAERDTARPACDRLSAAFIEDKDGDPDAPPEYCQGKGVRCEVQAFTLGKSAYQCHAILSDGSKVKGHFGKTAAMLRRPGAKKL